MTYNSKLIHYEKTVSNIDSISGSIEFTPPLQADNRRPHTLKVHRCIIPSSIPNIFNFAGVNTGLIEIKNGIDTETIQLDNGTYSIQSMNNAISTVLETLGWHDIIDPVFQLRANLSIGKIFIIIDSTKLTTGTQFEINFNYNNSMFYDVIGFSDTREYTVDGTYTASHFAKVDYQGSVVNVFIKGFGSLSILNGLPSEKAITINLDYGGSNNVIVYPASSGEVPFEIPCRVSNFTSILGIEFRGRDNKLIYCYDGVAQIDLSIYEY